MQRLLRTTALAFAALAVSSCATTDFVQVWRDPDYRAAPVDRVFVIAIIPNDKYRVTFENANAQALIAKGFDAATASSVFPPGQLDRAVVEAYVREKNVDLVVLERLVKEISTAYVPPTMAMAPGPGFGGWNGMWGWGWGGGGMMMTPGYYTDETTVKAETNVYAVKADAKMVWAAASSTFNFQDAGAAAKSSAAALVDGMIKAGILVR